MSYGTQDRQRSTSRGSRASTDSRRPLLASTGRAGSTTSLASTGLIDWYQRGRQAAGILNRSIPLDDAACQVIIDATLVERQQAAGQGGLQRFDAGIITYFRESIPRLEMKLRADHGSEGLSSSALQTYRARWNERIDALERALRSNIPPPPQRTRKRDRFFQSFTKSGWISAVLA